ncbi:MAG TPA: hypothetical protein VFV34_02895 [Blastocatellia bacterium]|nr:hypothetical protein [Blastocatellia bacterium]
MKKILSGVLLAGVICALTAVAFAENKTRDVKFYSDIVVNGTRVEKGTYRVSYDEATNEVTIMKGKTVVAKTTGRLEKLEKPSRSTQYNTADQGNGQALVSISFEGSANALVLGEGSSAGK